MTAPDYPPPPSPLSFVTLLPLLQESLANEGRFVLPLSGTSMRPTLPVACRVEIVPLSATGSDLPLGSLIVFAAGEALIVHRLVDRRTVDGRCHWIAQGDGRRAADAPILPEQVLGRVVRALDEGGAIIWPRRGEEGWARFWIERHHLLRVVRPLVGPLIRPLIRPLVRRMRRSG